MHIHVADRSGAYLLIALTALIGVAVGVVAVGRVGAGRVMRPPWRLAVILACACLIATGAYATSLSGFFDLHVTERHIALDGLLPGSQQLIDRSAVTRVHSVPSHKSTWRVVITTSSREVMSMRVRRDVADRVLAALSAELTLGT